MLINFIDVETTGLSSRFGRIIEVGVIKWRDGEVVDEFTSLINPGFKPDPYILKLTGIDVSELSSAPPFEHVAAHLSELLTEGVFVAHNVKFDYAFVKQEFSRMERRFRAPYLCTVKLSRHIFPGKRKHNLDKLAQRLGYEIADRHRALDDAKVLVEFFNKYHHEEFFPQLFDKLLTERKYPSRLKQKVQSPPSQSGVYIYRGEDSFPLYIGKSNNLKRRLNDHFLASLNDRKELTIDMRTERIDLHPTAGELGAALREASLIKETNPLYNKRLRKRKKVVAVVVSKNSSGYLTTSILRLDNDDLISEINQERVLGIYRSVHAAELYLRQIADRNQLCPKFLGLSHSGEECFAYHLHKCTGACIGKEKPDEYNKRFIKIMAALKLRRWPFPGKIVVTESSDSLQEVFLIENWIVLSAFQIEADKKTYSLRQPGFDYDHYLIIKKYLQKNSYEIFQDSSYQMADFFPQT